MSKSQEKNIRNLIFLLREKSHMLLIASDTYASLVNFIIGYELSKSNAVEKYSVDFNEWLMAKEGSEFSANWHSYILQKNDNDENMAKKMTIDYFEMFLLEEINA